MSLTYNWLRPCDCILVSLPTLGAGVSPIYTIGVKEGITADQALNLLKRHDYSAIDFDFSPCEVFFISDDEYESMIWAPDRDGDCWCRHLSIEGNLEYSDILDADSLPDQFRFPYRKEPERAVSLRNSRFEGTFASTYHWSSGDWSTYAGDSNGFHLEHYRKTGLLYETLDVVRRDNLTYDYIGYNAAGVRKKSGSYTLNVSQQCVTAHIQKSSGYSTTFLRDRYSRLVGHAAVVIQSAPLPRAREFQAAQEAALSYTAYDFNMIEAIADLKDGLGGQLPAQVADNLIHLIETSKFASLPSKIIDAAKVFADGYLYSKYVMVPTASDTTELLDIGSNSDINVPMQILAQQIVLKDKQLVSRYGVSSGEVFDESGVGNISYITRARVRAYPAYLKDMSEAAIIVDNIGLSLSAERLAEVVPYEFVANWFLPIEDSIRAVEYNDARLNSMWQIKGICISDTVTCSDGILRSLYGLGHFNGGLTFKFYQRSTRSKFPSVLLPAVAPTDINPSRVLQGSSLIITNL